MKHSNIFYRVLLVTMILSSGFQAQSQRDYAWEVGAGVGTTNYYGDVSPYRINHLKDVYRVYRFMEFNRHYVNRPSFSLLAHKKLNSTVGILLQANALQFSMSDRYRRANGDIDPNAPNFARSLNFQTDLYDIGFALSFSSNNGSVFKEEARFYPTFHLGLGLLTFTVKGDLYDEDGARYNNSLPGAINDGEFETRLRNLNTEDTKKYGNVAPYLNAGVALNFKITRNIVLAFQSDIKYAGTDYLDDVSKTYKANYPTAAAAYAARPGYNVVNPVTLQRGDNNGVNDIYINNRVVFMYKLRAKKQKPAFKAPVIYSIRRSGKTNKEIRRPFRNDSALSVLSRQSTDTLLYRRASISLRYRDSLRYANQVKPGNPLYVVSQETDSLARLISADTATRQTISSRLDAIQNDIRDIKTVIRNQTLISRYGYLQSQYDSITRLSEQLQLTRSATPSAGLRRRVYQLQKDSLRNEMRTMLWMSQYPANEIDSVILQWRPQGVQRYPDSAYLHADSPASNMAGETGIADSAVQLVAPRYQSRYKSDSVYMHRIDSLETKLSGYDSRSVNDFRKSDSAGRSYRQQLQRRLDSLEAQPARTSTNDPRMDSISAAVQSNNSTIENMRQNLKASRDSAAYYRRTLYAQGIGETDTIVEKRKWYERIIPRSRRARQDQEDTDEARSLRRQEAYFDQQTRKMNSDIEQLQRANRSLQNDYDQLRRNRNDRFISRSPTVVLPAPASNNNRQEINALRDEIAQLRTRLSAPDTSYTRAPFAISPAELAPPVVPAVIPPVVQPVSRPDSDSAQMATLRADIRMLQKELDSIRRTPTVAARSADPIYDVSSFPVISVYFAMNTATLPVTQTDKMAPIVSVAQKNRDAKIVLRGFADAVGNATVNKAIANKRIDYVRNLLVTKFGLSPAQIVVESPEIPLIKGAQRANPLDRRVDLQFQ